MLSPVRSSQFKKDVKRLEKREKDLSKLRKILCLLLQEEDLPASYKDHALKGEWLGFRDAHIEPDWLLIYAIVKNELQLARTGTHADIFEE